MSAQAALEHTLQALKSPIGKRKRTRDIEETIHEDKVRSPNKQRLTSENTTQKIYSPSSSDTEDKENGTPSKLNSPPSVRKRSLRLKDLSEKLKKRSSLGILSPKRSAAPAAPTTATAIPSATTTAPSEAPTTPKAEKSSDTNTVTPTSERKRSNLSQSHTEQQKRTPLPNAIKKKHFDLLRSPNHKKNSKFPEAVPSPKSPGLSRSVSLYNLPKPALPDESPTQHKSALPSPRTPSGQLDSPRKRIKKKVVYLSLRAGRKRSISDFKQLFLRNTEESSENPENGEAQIEFHYRYFSTDLNLLMHFQQCVLGLEEFKIPFIVYHCCQMIRQFYLKEEGIFRISPALSQLEEVVRGIEMCDGAGKNYLEALKRGEKQPKFKPHIYTGLLKKFLRDLPEPLLGSDSYYRWIGAIELYDSNPVGCLSQIKVLLKELSANQFNLLEYIVALARDVDQQSEDNKMNVSNLSRVIGPNILWNTSITDPSISSNHIALINNLANELIQNAELYFPNIHNLSMACSSGIQSCNISTSGLVDILSESSLPIGQIPQSISCFEFTTTDVEDSEVSNGAEEENEVETVVNEEKEPEGLPNDDPPLPAPEELQ